MNFQGNCRPTGIGSMPFAEPGHAARFTVELFGEVPYWPQLPRRSGLESMNPQLMEGFPGLEFEDGKLRVRIDDEFHARAEALLSGATEPSPISAEYASALDPFLELVAAAEPEAVKGQMSGPITFGFAIETPSGAAGIEDELLRELIIRHITAKAHWQYLTLSRLGKPVLLFLDEPYLASFGTAFFNWDRAAVVEVLKTVFDAVKARAAEAHGPPLYIGSHCCANTDWPIFPLSGASIVSFDAMDYADRFLLYEPELRRFLADGGNIAWGIVPTDPERLAAVDPAGLVRRLEQYFDRMESWGLDRALIAARSLITPACGLGFQPVETAQTAFRYAREVADELRSRCL